MDKLKMKGGSPTAVPASVPDLGVDDDDAHALQLPLDVFQSDHEIIVYAQLAGVHMHTLDVSITGENDTVTIQGTSVRPEHLMHDAHAGRSGDYALEECRWGDFFRKIILPAKVDPERTEAKIKDGVLALRLPLMGSVAVGQKVTVVRADDNDESA